MPPNPRLVPKLRALRERAALSQRDLAERSGVGKATILKLERGRQRAYPGTIQRLAEALGTTPGDLGAEATTPEASNMPVALETLPAAVDFANRYPKRRWTSAEIEADLALMAADPDYQAEALELEAEYALAGWEALQIGERPPADESEIEAGE